MQAAVSFEDQLADDQVGAIRSWDIMTKVGDPNGYTKANRHEHYLTIIDNMVSMIVCGLLLTSR
jgi:hypothetical protein